MFSFSRSSPKRSHLQLSELHPVQQDVYRERSTPQGEISLQATRIATLFLEDGSFKEILQNASWVQKSFSGGSISGKGQEIQWVWPEGSIEGVSLEIHSLGVP